MNGEKKKENWAKGLIESTSRLRKYFKIPEGQFIPIKMIDDELLRLKERRPISSTERPPTEPKAATGLGQALPGYDEKALLDDLVRYKQGKGFSMFQKGSSLFGLEKRQLRKRG